MRLGGELRKPADPSVNRKLSKMSQKPWTTALVQDMAYQCQRKKNGVGYEKLVISRREGSGSRRLKKTQSKYILLLLAHTL